MSDTLPVLETIGDEHVLCCDCGGPMFGQLAEVTVTADGRAGRRRVVDPIAAPEHQARQLLEIYSHAEKVVTAAIEAGTDTNAVYDALHELRDKLTDHLADALVALLAASPGPQPLPARLPRRCSADHSAS